MFSKKIGVGVIGTGMAAKPHALALNDLKEIIDVKAIFSRNKDRCNSFANNYNFEMTHSTVIRVDNSAVNKEDLKKIFLSEVPTEIYPEIEKKFFEIVKSIGYPNIKLEKRINFKDLFEKNQK